MKKSLTALLVFAVSFASAGTVRPATVTVEATMNIKDGAVQGCGYRFVLIPEQIAAGMSIDASISIYSSGLALSKAGLLRLDTSGKEPKLQPVEIDSYWIKTGARPPLKFFPKPGFIKSIDPKGYLLANFAMSEAAPAFEAFVAKGSVTVGARRKTDSIDYILSGTALPDAATLKSFGECIESMIGPAEQEAK